MNLAYVYLMMMDISSMLPPTPCSCGGKRQREKRPPTDPTWSAALCHTLVTTTTLHLLCQRWVRGALQHDETLCFFFGQHTCDTRSAMLLGKKRVVRRGDICDSFVCTKKKLSSVSPLHSWSHKSLLRRRARNGFLFSRTSTQSSTSSGTLVVSTGLALTVGIQVGLITVV